MKTTTLKLLIMAALTMTGGHALAQEPDAQAAPGQKDGIKKIDRMPTFQGGNPNNTFCRWIIQKMDSLDTGLGSARFTFVVDRQGYVTYVSRVRCSDTVIRDHVEDLLLASPRWSPAMIGDDSVCMGYIVNYEAKRLKDNCELIYVVNSKSIPHDPENPPVRIEQSAAKFDGGPVANVSQWIASKIGYPKALKARGLTGTVVALVTVAADGKVTTTILRSPDPEMSREVERVMRSVGSHITPATINYTPISTRFTVPIEFKLQ